MVKDSSLIPVTAGLLALFAMLSTLVLRGTTELPKTPDAVQAQESARKEVLYFIDAETLAQKAFPEPSARWYRAQVDARTYCHELGHGVWHTGGTVEAPTSAGTVAQHQWDSYFLADRQQPLCVKVGDRQAGDCDAALRRAGLTSAPW